MAQKPASMLVNEARENILNTIRNTDLHVSVLEMVVRDVLNIVHLEAENAARQEAELYEIAVRQEREEEGEEDGEDTEYDES